MRADDALEVNWRQNSYNDRNTVGKYRRGRGGRFNNRNNNRRNNRGGSDRRRGRGRGRGSRRGRGRGRGRRNNQNNNFRANRISKDKLDDDLEEYFGVSEVDRRKNREQKQKNVLDTDLDDYWKSAEKETTTETTENSKTEQ